MPLFNTVSAITKLDTYNVKQLETALKVFDEKLKNKDTTGPTRKKLEKMKKQYQDQITKTKGLFKKYSARGRLPGFNSATVSVQQMYKALSVNVVGGDYAADTDTFWGKIAAHPTAAASIVVGAGVGLQALLKLPGVKEGLVTALKEVGKFLVGGSPAALGVWAGALIITPFIIGAIKKVMARNRALKLDVENAINKDTVYDFNSLGKNYEANKEKLIEDALTGGQKDEIITHLSNIAATPTNSPTERANALKLIHDIRVKDKENQIIEQQLNVKSIFAHKDNRKILSNYYAIKDALDNIIKADEPYNNYLKYETDKNKAASDFNKAKRALSKSLKEYNKFIEDEKLDSKYAIKDANTDLTTASKPDTTAVKAGTNHKDKADSIIANFDNITKFEKVNAASGTADKYDFKITANGNSYNLVDKANLKEAIDSLISNLTLNSVLVDASDVALSDTVKQFKEFITLKIIDAAKRNELSEKKENYNNKEQNFNDAEKKYNDHKKDLANATAKRDKALSEYNFILNGIIPGGASAFDFNTFANDTKDDLIYVLDNTGYFEASVIASFKDPSTSLNEILEKLKNFLPGKEELKKEDSLLIKD